MNLVFSGGGVNGAYFIGVIQFLRLSGIKLDGFAGTSIGALVALMCALNMSVPDMRGVFRRLLDSDVSRQLLGIVLDLLGGDLTFAQLFKITCRELIVCAMSVNTTKITLFSCESTPDLSVARSVVAAMSFPFMFPPVQINDELFIDAGFAMNLPMCAFKNKPALGAWLCTDSKVVSTQELLESNATYGFQVLRTVWYASDHLTTYTIDPSSVIKIAPRYPIFERSVNIDHMVFCGGFACFRHFEKKATHSNTLQAFILFFLCQKKKF